MADQRGEKAEPSRCVVCGHAESKHNDLYYCQVRSKTRGDCTCNGFTAHRSGIRPGWPYGGTDKGLVGVQTGSRTEEADHG